MTKILLVEDEAVLADTIVFSVQKLGYACTWVQTLRAARLAFGKEQFDLMILDRNLPDGDGVDLLSDPRTQDILTLILSSKSNLEDRVLGLRSGADDYLPKPFSFQELGARLEALKRRKPVRVSPENPGVSSEAKRSLWQLDPNTLRVLAPTGWIVLTPLEFKFLSYLIERADTIVSKDRLLREVWGFSFLPKTRTVDYLITQLRKRIEPNPETPQHLLTVRGAGVKLSLSNSLSGATKK